MSDHVEEEFPEDLWKHYVGEGIVSDYQKENLDEFWMNKWSSFPEPRDTAIQVWWSMTHSRKNGILDLDDYIEQQRNPWFRFSVRSAVDALPPKCVEAALRMAHSVVMPGRPHSEVVELLVYFHQEYEGNISLTNFWKGFQERTWDPKARDYLASIPSSEKMEGLNSWWRRMGNKD